MDVFAGFHGRVLAAVQQLKHDGVVPHDASIDGITLEPPKDAGHGDLATNAAMVLAKAAGKPPRALAERIVPLLAVRSAYRQGRDRRARLHQSDTCALPSGRACCAWCWSRAPLMAEAPSARARR